jgi:hypothetical protein
MRTLYLALQWLSLALMVVALVFLCLTIWELVRMNRPTKIYIQELKPVRMPGSLHSHPYRVEGCYRCDLMADEVK